MQRRKFIKDACSLCLVAGSASLLSVFLESCSNIPYYKTTSKNKKVLIPLSNFEKTEVVVVSPSNYEYDIAVFRTSESKFRSLLMRCTHADNPLQYNGDKFRCNLHGSVYNQSGNVEKGPAEKSMVELITTQSEDSIIIQLR